MGLPPTWSTVLASAATMSLLPASLTASSISAPLPPKGTAVLPLSQMAQRATRSKGVLVVMKATATGGDGSAALTFSSSDMALARLRLLWQRKRHVR